jgi:predicted PhzF superfamily epimerase YddE/YHI9
VDCHGFPGEELHGTRGSDRTGRRLGLRARLNGMDYLVEVANETVLRALNPNFSALSLLPVRGVIVTCRSESPEFDFISRFFAPVAQRQ